MSIGLVGRKCGMTRIFTEAGEAVPVTLIEMTPNRITQIKTAEHDGYAAIQVTTGAKRTALLSKSAQGHFAKANVEAGRGLWEFRLTESEVSKFKIGEEIKPESVFTAGQKIDVAAISKGKGFAGTIKRHNFTMGDATHGNSLSHRAPGSIGQRQTPGRVFPGKRMAGHMGQTRQTMMNLEVVNINAERSLLSVRGSVPGATGSDVFVKPAAKA